MTKDVVVIGLGYVGLPLARDATRAGLSVIGSDIDQTVVASLNQANSHVDDVTGTDLEGMLQASFRATTVRIKLADAGAAWVRAHWSWAANAQRYAHLYPELTGPDRDARDDGGTE